MIISNKPTVLLSDNEWLSEFGELVSIRHGDYGLVQSKHVLYGDGLKVEYGVTNREWTKTKPVDSETGKVVKDGIRILYEPKNAFQKLRDAIYHPERA